MANTALAGTLDDATFAWVAFLDAYGFSNELRQRSDGSITSMFKALGNEISVLRASLSAAFQFSDSIFLINAVLPEPHEGLAQVIKAIASLQKCAIMHGFAFRGGVTAGQITITEHGCYGTPIVSAVRLEGSLAAPIVAIPSKYLNTAAKYVDRDKSYGSPYEFHLERRIIQTKTGDFEGHVIEPPLRSFADLAHRKIQEALVEGPDHVPRAWRAALQHLHIQRSDTSENQ